MLSLEANFYCVLNSTVIYLQEVTKLRVPLMTAETQILAYFNKGNTKEFKKDVHLLPACRELKLKNIRAKENADLTMLLAKELLLRKHDVKRGRRLLLSFKKLHGHKEETVIVVHQLCFFV